MPWPLQPIDTILPVCDFQNVMQSPVVGLLNIIAWIYGILVGWLCLQIPVYEAGYVMFLEMGIVHKDFGVTTYVHVMLMPICFILGINA